MMLRHIRIGPATTQTSLLIYIAAFFLAVEITRRYASKRNIDSNLAQNALMLGGIGGLLGARVAYALQNWSVYKSNLRDWFSITPQGLNVVGGVVVGSSIIFAYLRWKKVEIRSFLDALAPAIGVSMILIPLGLLADESVIGKPSTLPWAIDLQLESRHPTQLYAMIGSGITLAIWWKWMQHRPLDGEGFLFIFAGNGLTWLLVGLLLAEPVLVLGNYRLVQVFGWAVLIGTAFLWSLWTDKAQAEKSTQTPLKT